MLMKKGVFRTVHGAWERLVPTCKRSDRKHGRTGARRSLLLEPLETRALLSVSIGPTQPVAIKAVTSVAAVVSPAKVPVSTVAAQSVKVTVATVATQYAISILPPSLVSTGSGSTTTQTQAPNGLPQMPPPPMGPATVTEGVAATVQVQAMRASRSRRTLARPT